ncbi:MAG: sortase [Wenzhouxiangella sp.]|nr:MAG: sortase [Wenzhouxiangella sp.]
MMRSLVILTMLATGLWQTGQGVSVQLKAWLGQHLLERAWVQTSQSDHPVLPWPGAISHPVARLRVPELAIDQLVLDGADTPVLAWGPGMEIGPNGHRLIAAHRDTHFRFLQHLALDQVLELEGRDGSIRLWQVVERRIVDSRRYRMDMNLAEERLTLVTCYPFNATAAGGPLRLVIGLEPLEQGVKT